MSDINNIENHECNCVKTVGFGKKLAFLVLGGGIGAAVSLLFAPKPGRELRADIADKADRAYEDTLKAANRWKEQTTQYYETARERGGEVMDVVVEGVSEVKKEIKADAAKVGDIVEGVAKRAANSIRPVRV